MSTLKIGLPGNEISPVIHGNTFETFRPTGFAGRFLFSPATPIQSGDSYRAAKDAYPPLALPEKGAAFILQI